MPGTSAPWTGSGRAYMRKVFARVDQRVDDGGTVVPACVLDGLFEFGQSRHSPAPRAKRRRRGRKIDRAVANAVVRVPAPLLRDLNQTERAVVVHDRDERNAVADACF